MNVKSIERKGNEATVVVEIDKELMESGVNKAYMKARKSIQLPGFRKGKAPRKMIEAMYELGVYDAKEKLQQVKKFLRESKEESRDYTHGQAQQQTAVTQQTR